MLPRPKPVERVPVTVQIDKRIFAAIQKNAAKSGTTVEDTMAVILELWFNVTDPKQYKQRQTFPHRVRDES